MRTLPILLVVLFLLPIASALESFSLTATTPAACTNLPNLATLTIVNTGAQDSTYLIRARQDGLSSIEIEPATFTLKPGRRRESIVNFLPSASGPLTLIFEVETGRGAFQRLTQTLNAGYCTNNQVLVRDFNQTSCPCEAVSYDLSVTNTGAYPETYAFALDKYSTSANLTQNPVTLAAGASANVRLSLQLDCAISGPQVVRFYSNAQRSGVTTMVPLLLNINACYDYAFETPSSESVCSSDTERIPMRVRNDAGFTNTFSLSLEGPSWGSLSANRTTLDPGEEETVYLIVSPTRTGSSVFTLNSLSTLGTIRQRRSVPVMVETCYDLDVELPERAILCAETENAVDALVSNLGTEGEEVALTVSGTNFTSLDDSVSIDSHSQKSVSLILSPSRPGNGKLVLSASTEKASASDSISFSTVSKQACYQLSITAPRSIRAFGETEVPVTIKNRGVREASYRAELQAPDGVSIEPASLALEPGQSSSFKLFVPGSLALGRYNVSLTFTTDDGQTYQKEMKLAVADKPGFWDNVYTFRYIILTGIAFLILLLLVGVWLFRHPPAPGVWWGLGIAIALIAVALWALNTNTPVFSRVLGFFQTYIRYILVGILLSILVIIVLNRTEE